MISNLNFQTKLPTPQKVFWDPYMSSYPNHENKEQDKLLQ